METKKQIEELKARILMLEKALVLLKLYHDPYAKEVRVPIIAEEFDSINITSLKIEHNIENEPIVVLNFESDLII